MTHPLLTTSQKSASRRLPSIYSKLVSGLDTMPESPRLPSASSTHYNVTSCSLQTAHQDFRFRFECIT